MDIILNKIAIWSPHGSKTLTYRKVPNGTRYLEGNSPVFKYCVGNLYRYAKDYVVDGVQFCLFLRSECTDIKLMEIALDHYASKITKKEALEANELAKSGNFDYTVYLFDEKKAHELAEEGEK